MHAETVIPRRCLKKGDGGTILRPVEETKNAPAAEEKDERVILCRNCRKKITSHRYIIEMDGRHQHTFANPEGVMFTIGCFSDAEGCVNRGTPTLEFTWFTGFSWRFSLCANCFMHLGWFYRSRTGNAFYGLILSHLLEGG